MEFRHFIHAPVELALVGKPLTLQILMADSDVLLPTVTLCYTVSGKDAFARMWPTDGYRAEQGYTLFSATVPATAMVGEQLSYRFLLGEQESAVFTVPLTAAVLPPLLMTESQLWPLLYPYFEVKNMTDQAVDLYEYDLLTVSPSGERRRSRMASAAGESLVPGGARALCAFTKEAVSAESYDRVRDEFFTALENRYPDTCTAMREQVAHCFFAPQAPCEDVEGEPAVLFSRNTYGNAIYLVPHAKGEEAALYKLPCVFTETRRDARVRLATRWQFSPKTPREGVIKTPIATPTPGFLDRYEVDADFADTVAPAVLPVAPTSRISLSEGDIRVRFAVLGGTHIGRATVFVREGEVFCPYEALLDDEGLLTATVPYRTVMHMGEAFCYYIAVQGGLYGVTLGSAAHPLTAAIVDDAGPLILSTYPAPYQVLENETALQLSVSYDDASGVNTRICALCLDGLNVSEHAVWSEERVTFEATDLAFGTHTVEITLRDMRGNRTYYNYDFAIGDGKEMMIYCGQVHSHTIDSDGSGTPEQAYAYARDITAMDYFAVTDHSSCYVAEDYYRQIAVADRFNEPNRFAALYGFEMTWHDVTGFWGHTNLLNSKWVCVDPVGYDLDAYNKGVAEESEAIGMFNHPGDTWGNNNDFKPYDRRLRDIYALYELNGTRHHQSYALALTKGWRVSPVYNEDNHHADWGDSGGMGFVLAPALTRENILDAMRRRRTYSSTDRTMRVLYRVNGAWLGSVLQAPEKLDVEVEVSTEYEGGIGHLELVTEDSIVVAEVDAGALCEFRWCVELPPDFDYYYLRISGTGKYTVTAPVFIEGRDALALQKLQYGVSEDAEHPHVMVATVKNQGDKPLGDVTVDFYLTGENAFTLRRLAPFEEVHIGKLLPGEVRKVSRRLPDVLGAHRVTAIASGMNGKDRYADVRYVHISPVTITKLMPLTAPVQVGDVTVGNPYAYVELYNHTARPLSLKGYSLGLWRGMGGISPPAEDRVLPLDGFTLPPQSTLTVWLRGKNNPLTAADFNAHYGVTLLEGEDLLLADAFPWRTDNAAKKLDLRRGKEILTRIPFGYYCSHDTDIESERVLCYALAPHRTVAERYLALSEGEEPPRPGKLLPAQQPRTLGGLCRKQEAMEAERSAVRREVFTRLTKASLVPFRAAAFVANAVSAFKGFFDMKEETKHAARVGVILLTEYHASFIRLRRVLLLRSDIRLMTSDIRYASIMANKISLKP